MLEVIGVTKIYSKNENQVIALKNVSLSIRRNEFVAIIGDSGSGKSTLLHLIGGLDSPNTGRILLDGNDICDYGEDKLVEYRRENIGFVFQNFNLIPVLNVYDNIVFPLHIRGAELDYEFIDSLLEFLNISEKKDSFPNTLSGGQQQRVAIARAMAGKPKLLLADEPTGNLDSKNSKLVFDLFRECVDSFEQTVILITHNNELAERADRVVVIRDGMIL